MVLAMLGALYPRAGLSLFLLYLVLAAALLRPQPPRSQRAVPEEFSGPLEVSEPISGLVDGSLFCPFPSLGEGPRPALRVSSAPTAHFTRRPSLPSDYGVRPKHPWPRGPRPLLSRAQQRKRDGPDMAEYYYDAHL
ncbi:protein Frey 1 [Tenrec ecaudatus]|uniref:protein Frey 1 n=1 Tax=Tenrec ecaudatus TaxID=94439 RepID=UPI003F592E31